MKRNNQKYTAYNLVNEMFECVSILENFDQDSCAFSLDAVKTKSKLMLTGEGSSRIFPAKRAVYESHTRFKTTVETDASLQLLDHNLHEYAIFAASYSGKTSEVVTLFKHLKAISHNAYFCQTVFPDSPLYSMALQSYQLHCGNEKAVAATKSVIENALFYQGLLNALNNEKMYGLSDAARQFNDVLEMDVSPGIIRLLTQSKCLLWCGKNNGVAEELRLKTNEIARSKSDYLESSYILHGVEEILIPGDDVVILIEPYVDIEKKIDELIRQKLGIAVVAISTRETIFPTIKIPQNLMYQEYLQLAAGWNLLVEVALAKNIDMDKTERARKVGNAVADIPVNCPV